MSEENLEFHGEYATRESMYLALAESMHKLEPRLLSWRVPPEFKESGDGFAVYFRGTFRKL